MYQLVEKENVLSELNKGAYLLCVDPTTLKTMICDELNLQQIKAFILKPEALFIKRVTDE